MKNERDVAECLGCAGGDTSSHCFQSHQPWGWVAIPPRSSKLWSICQLHRSVGLSLPRARPRARARPGTRWPRPISIHLSLYRDLHRSLHWIPFLGGCGRYGDSGDGDYEEYGEYGAYERYAAGDMNRKVLRDGRTEEKDKDWLLACIHSLIWIYRIRRWECAGCGSLGPKPGCKGMGYASGVAYFFPSHHSTLTLILTSTLTWTLTKIRPCIPTSSSTSTSCLHDGLRGISGHPTDMGSEAMDGQYIYYIAPTCILRV